MIYFISDTKSEEKEHFHLTIQFRVPWSNLSKVYMLYEICGA